MMRALKMGLAVAGMLAWTASAPAQGLRNIAIGVGGAGFGGAPVRFAKEMGLFEKHGLNASVTVMDSASAAMSALLSKSVDAAIAGPTEIIAAQARGQKVAILVNTYAGLAGTLVLSKATADKLGVSPTAPIRDRIKALDGLSIATPSASSSYGVTLRAAAASAGITIRFTYIGTQALASALEAGAIQGYIAGAPTWTPPVTTGSGVVWISGPKGELPPEFVPASSSSLQVLTSSAKLDPPLMKAIAAVFVDFVKALDDRPAEVKAAIAKVYPGLDPNTLDLLFETESGAWRAKPLTAEKMKQEVAFVKSSGIALPPLDNLDLESLLVH